MFAVTGSHWRWSLRAVAGPDRGPQLKALQPGRSDYVARKTRLADRKHPCGAASTPPSAYFREKGVASLTLNDIAQAA